MPNYKTYKSHVSGAGPREQRKQPQSPSLPGERVVANHWVSHRSSAYFENFQVRPRQVLPQKPRDHLVLLPRRYGPLCERRKCSPPLGSRTTLRRYRYTFQWAESGVLSGRPVGVLGLQERVRFERSQVRLRNCPSERSRVIVIAASCSFVSGSEME